MLGAALLDDDGSYSSTIGFINDNNSSTTAATYQHLAVKLQSCSEWEKSQHGLFQAANCLYAASLFIPHHTFRWTISIGRIMTGLAHLLFSLWACLILCSPDVFAWHCLMTLTTSVHVVYWTWQFRPFRARIRPPLLELYQKLFLPLDASPDLFVLLINKSVIRNLEPGDEYFTTFDPAHSMRLSFLLTGKLHVTFGSRLLHHITPLQFVDSPEWYAIQNAFPNDLKASKPQVAISAAERSTLLQLDPDHLQAVLATNSSLKFLLDCLIGKDVSEKLYAVAEQASLPISSGCQQQAAGSGNGGRLSSSQAGGSVGLNGSTATAATSSFGPWESEVSRSQSADAVHTVHTGQMRSIHWRRDETRKVWGRKYEKLVPSHHRQMSSKSNPGRATTSSIVVPAIKHVPPSSSELQSLMLKRKRTASPPPKTHLQSTGSRYRRAASPHHQVQFGETFV